MVIKKEYTLCIITRNNQALIARKKRGFGAGKFIGFGGKVEPGESVMDAAAREVYEESGLRVENLQRFAVVEFSFVSIPEKIQYVHFFTTNQFTGTPVETEEMHQPQWFDIHQMPHDQMWADEKYWWPLFTSGKQFIASFHYDRHEGGETILHHSIKPVDSLSDI